MSNSLCAVPGAFMQAVLSNDNGNDVVDGKNESPGDDRGGSASVNTDDTCM